MRPRLLDLFCGAGGAAMGYHRAGFDVVGVDHLPQPNYPFEFVQADALDFLREIPCLDGEGGVCGGCWGCAEFDAIHASPPCQLFSAYQRANRHQGEHLNLIPQTREFLQATGLPYVIENVPGAPLEDPVTICGVMFESNVPLIVPPCACGGWMPARFDRGSRATRPNDRRTVAVGEWRIEIEVQQRAMEIDWMTVRELSQAIPPAYTELIGHQLLAHVQAAVA